MPPAPQSHAEICQVDTGNDQGKRLAHIEDELSRRSKSLPSLTPLCFEGLVASVSRRGDDPFMRVFTFVTRDGKSLQISVAHRVAREFSLALVDSLVGERRGRPCHAR